MGEGGGGVVMINIDDQEGDRKRYSDLIINSPARKKIIVAGPGTGKTFTFRELLKGRNGNALALTFINNLADDLKKDLDGLAESKTFHGYCIKLLYENPVGGVDANFMVFPKLPKIIRSDEKLLFGRKSNFDDAFQCLIEDDGRIDFYIARANFYNAVGFDDSVYRVLQYFKSGFGEPPQYEQVVIDEFQDFNRLEVAFIEEIEKVNPILIVGDDDQAIYYDLKNASSDFIREKAKDLDYERFELPYCSRCTEAIVDAVDDIITHAKANGNLTNRVDKNYVCYLPDKLQDSLNYPKIVHAKCSVQRRNAPYISMYIEREIQKIPKEEIDLANEKGYPCVLIIGPGHYLREINNFLVNNYEVDYEGNKEKNDLHILDGYKILLEDGESNLGWRIILESDKVEDMNDIIGMTYTDQVDIVEQLQKKYRYKHEKVIDLLSHLRENTVSIEEQNELKKIIDLDLNEIKTRLEIKEEDENDKTQKTDLQEDSQPSIKLTTYPSSKGLSGGFVFIVGLNDGTFPRTPDSPSDYEVCQFIVALTRARKKCYLISNRGFGKEHGLRPSKFIDWIDGSKLSIEEVNAKYFK